jgi:hypothetical protein
MNRRRLSFATDRDISHIEHGLDEAVQTLRKYLKNKLEIVFDETHGTGERRKKPRYNKTDTLVFSCAFIGRRIIRKYSRGEVPHTNRLRLWDAMLEIISKLEADKVLQSTGIKKWKHKGLIFRCKIYEHKDFTLVIPQQPPKKKKLLQWARYNPVMEQNFPDNITEKHSATTIVEYHKRHFI